ncbi:hypothetical protein MES4922_40190 [Mesorhizobium ventifaucium]|uniref:Uncharacterized protein n=1 Tax=Mesorhizobium ventifaucium TaxID=666020 RepID=A0ABM9E831_9HYPH|nr:hypothetical protein MES4922_40190 [Mesorhizobium ventifaucium]
MACDMADTVGWTNHGPAAFRPDPELGLGRFDKAHVISSREIPMSLRMSSGDRLNPSVIIHIAFRSARRRNHPRM